MINTYLFCVLFSFAVSLQAQTEPDTTLQQLQTLQLRVQSEQQQTEAWLKALQRAGQRNAEMLAQHPGDEQDEARQRLQRVQQSLQDKQLLLARYRLQLNQVKQQIPIWRDLWTARQTNLMLRQQIQDTELLLDQTRHLDSQAWLSNSPEQLWRQLNPDGWVLRSPKEIAESLP